MPVLVSIRLLASGWDARKNAWKVARASFLALKYAKAMEADCIVYEDAFPDASE